MVRRDAILFFLIALAYRALFLLETHSEPLFSILAIDAQFYHDLASRFAAGQYGTEPLWYAPLYPVLLMLLFRIGGTDPQVVVALQFVLGAGTAAVGVLLGSRVSRTVGRITGGVLALSPVFVFYENQLLYASLAVFFTALFLLALLRAMDAATTPVRARALGAGVAFGLLLLLRTNALLFTPFAMAALYWKGGVRRAAWFGLGLVLVLTPVLLRNGLVSGAWTPLTVNGGMIFATGFAEESIGGRALQRTPYDFGPDGAYQREAQRRTGRDLTLAEASDWYRKDTLQRIRMDPAWAARLTLKKVRLLLSSREVDDNLGFPFLRERARTLRWLPSPWAVVMLPAVAGLVVLIRRRDLRRFDGWVLAAYAAVYAASLLLFFVNARYRLPMVVPAAVLAGMGVESLVATARSGRWRDWLWPGAAVVLFAFPVLRDPGVRANPAFLASAVGAALVQQGHAQEGLRYVDQAIALEPGLAGAHQNRATALLALNRPAEAFDAAVEATRLDPELFEPWMTIGAVLAREGRLAEALPAFQQAVGLRPDHLGALRNLAQALGGTGQWAEAAAVGQRAVAAGAADLIPRVNEWSARSAESSPNEAPAPTSPAPTRPAPNETTPQPEG